MLEDQNLPEPVDDQASWVEDTPKLPTIPQPEDWNEDEIPAAPKVSSWGGSGGF